MRKTGAPLTLISQLARHTRTLQASAAASVLIDHSNISGDAASGGRVSLMGSFIPATDADVPRRFLARHPDAQSYAGFGDFAFYRMEVSEAHMVEGFGRIVTLQGTAMTLTEVEGPEFGQAEGLLLPALQQRWPAVTGFDAEGVDLIITGAGARITFERPQKTADAAYGSAANCLSANDQSV